MVCLFQDLQIGNPNNCHGKFAYILLLNKNYVNGMTLKEQNQSLIYCQPLELLIYLGKGIKYFYTSNIGAIGQKAAKLVAVKVRGYKKKSDSSAIAAKTCAIASA